MAERDQDFVERSIANLWTFNAIFLSQLLSSLRGNGLPTEEIEALLQRLDEEANAVLEGDDDKLHAAELLASVRSFFA